MRPRDADATTAARLAGVSVRFASTDGDVVALDSVDLTLRSGTSTAVVGRSGSGKSTLVSVLTLMRRPTTGTVHLGDVDTATLSSAARAHIRAREVGIVFQSFHLEPSLTVLENVMLQWFFDSGAASRRAAQRRAATLLDALGIADLARRRPLAMSGGQRQRVAIARAVFPEPRLLVADEPTGNLDEETAGSVTALLTDLPRDLGTTVVVVTHDSEVAALADDVVNLQRGTVVAGPPLSVTRAAGL